MHNFELLQVYAKIPSLMSPDDHSEANSGGVCTCVFTGNIVA